MGEKGAQIFSECQLWASIEVNIGVYCKTVSAVLSFVGGAQRKNYPQHGRMEGWMLHVCDDVSQLLSWRHVVMRTGSALSLVG